MYLVGYVKNCDGDVVPVIRDIVNGASAMYFFDGFEVEVVYGFDDLPIEEIPSSETAVQLKEIVVNKLRGDEYRGFIWMSDNRMIGIKDIDYFSADLIPKKSGGMDITAYENGQVVSILADDIDDAEYFEEIMDALDSNV